MKFSVFDLGIIGLAAAVKYRFETDLLDSDDYEDRYRKDSPYKIVLERAYAQRRTFSSTAHPGLDCCGPSTRCARNAMSRHGTLDIPKSAARLNRQAESLR